MFSGIEDKKNYALELRKWVVQQEVQSYSVSHTPSKSDS